MGGFITTAARLARSNIRPLLLPAPGEKLSAAKQLYDVVGTILSTAILNYAASPFMLLSAADSFTTWSRLGYYGHIIVGGGLVFFYTGGSKYLKRLQKKRGVIPSTKAPTNGREDTPISEKTLVLPPTLDRVIPPSEI
jgi:lysophospholipid acyltransferase